MIAYRRYLLAFAATVLGAVLLIGALNLFVDPYDRFGFNQLGTYISADREYKGTEFQRFAPDSVLLGNSRAAIINVGRLNTKRCFNAAFAAAEPEEIRDFIEHYVRGQKFAVLGLDLFMLKPAAQPVADPFQPLSVHRAFEYTLSLKNAEYSLRTIANSLAGKPRDYSPDGTFREANWAAKADNADAATIDRKERELVDQLSNFRFDPARLEALRESRDLLQRRGIALLVFLPPINARAWADIRGTVGYEQLLAARDAVKQIFPDAIDLTDSEYSAPEGFFRADPLHFRSAVGERLLNERVLPSLSSNR